MIYLIFTTFNTYIYKRLNNIYLSLYCFVLITIIYALNCLELNQILSVVFLYNLMYILHEKLDITYHRYDFFIVLLIIIGQLTFFDYIYINHLIISYMFSRIIISSIKLLSNQNTKIYSEIT